MRGIFLGLVFIGCFAPSCEASKSTPISAERYKDIIADRLVTFVGLRPVGEDFRGYVLNYKHTREQFSPFSTFKIINTVIALETGVATGADFALAYDPVRNPKQGWWPKEWAQDQTLATAFKRSAVWYYQELARRIGEEQYNVFLKKFWYGNGDVSGGIDQFWLSSTLKISPSQQIQFLPSIRDKRSGISERTISILDDISLIETADDYSLHGKSGAGPVDRASTDDPLMTFKGRFGGWLVGWIKGPDAKIAYFALYCEGPDFASIAKFRLEMARRLLVDHNFLPTSFAPTQP